MRDVAASFLNRAFKPGPAAGAPLLFLVLQQREELVARRLPVARVHLVEDLLHQRFRQPPMGSSEFDLTNI